MGLELSHLNARGGGESISLELVVELGSRTCAGGSQGGVWEGTRRARGGGDGGHGKTWALNLLDRSRAPHLLARSSEATITRMEVPASRAIAALAGKDGTRRISMRQSASFSACAKLCCRVALEEGRQRHRKYGKCPRGKNHAGFVSAISGGVSEANWPIHLAETRDEPNVVLVHFN